ncbi:hypothetical protein [Prosthecobacter sp.]|uniref:hypothetical protein n=1 Tax=Prosthecobacter sp. TaxID=1965333 RepID=UPI0037840951
MLFWTHIFDLLAKLTFMALTVAMFLFSVPDPPAKGHPFLFVLSFIAGIVIWWLCLRPLSSWLHARLRLGARLSWGQARRASMLFSPVRDLLRWHPLWEVRHLPETERVAAIEEAMVQLQAEQRAKAAQLRAAPVLSHAIRWLNVVVIIAAIVLTANHLPPASWVSEFQVRVFNGGYYPILTGIILAAPVITLLKALELATAPRRITIVENPPGLEDMAAVTAHPQQQPEKAPDSNDHSRFAPPGG